MTSALAPDPLAWAPLLLLKAAVSRVRTIKTLVPQVRSRESP